VGPRTRAGKRKRRAKGRGGGGPAHTQAKILSLHTHNPQQCALQPVVSRLAMAEGPFEADNTLLKGGADGDWTRGGSGRPGNRTSRLTRRRTDKTRGCGGRGGGGRTKTREMWGQKDWRASRRKDRRTRPMSTSEPHTSIRKTNETRRATTTPTKRPRAEGKDRSLHKGISIRT